MTSTIPATPRRLDPREDAAAAALFTGAFLHDPFTVAVGPEHPGLRRRLLTRQYLTDLQAVRRSGGTVLGLHRDGQLVGALTADTGPVQLTRRPSPSELTMAPAGPAVLARCLRGERALARARPATPHVYILKVAVTAEARGSGLGGALVHQVIESATARGLPVLLDTMTEANVAFYEHLGFHTTRQLDLPRGCTAWLMTRPV